MKDTTPIIKEKQLQTRYYAVNIVYSPKLSLDLIKKENENFEKLITGLKGSMKKTVDLGKKTLAYSIKKHNSGHYVLYYVSFKPYPALGRAITEIKKKLNPKINENIIRHTFIKLDSEDFNHTSLKEYEGFNFKINL